VRDTEVANLAQWRRENARERSKAAARLKKWWQSKLRAKKMKGFFDVVRAAKALAVKSRARAAGGGGN